jgi:tetratricopeptide (TPR) repeat protein
MQFEMTRVDPQPDVGMLILAAEHAREACRLDAQSAEAWATLGFVLGRGGSSMDALAAARRAVSLEPENWRHHVRLAYAGWGEERLHSARRTLALLPGLPIAHWLAATVYVARQVFDDAMRELEAGIASEIEHTGHDSRFSSVALHWLLGLIHLARGDHAHAREEFDRELALESGGHVYARECCANTWYAVGALHLRQGRPREASTAFAEAIARVAMHPMTRVGLAATAQGEADADERSLLSRTGGNTSDETSMPFEIAQARAARLAMKGAHDEAAQLIDQLLAKAQPGNACWLLPVEPLLNVAAHPESWSRPLARLRNRAA